MTKLEKFAEENSPCKPCKERYGGCHAVCEKGLKYEEEYRKVRDEETAEKYRRVSLITSRHKNWIDKTYPRGK